MPERPNKLDSLKQTVDRLNKIWSNFPEFMHPDTKSFKTGLVIGEIPKKFPLPTFYDGIKSSYIDALKSAYSKFIMPEDTFTDHETGKTHINPRVLSYPERILEDFLAYQISIFTYMKGQRTDGHLYDNDEIKTVNEYMNEICERVPALNDTYITRRGFERRLYYKNESYIAGLPPKGYFENIEDYDVLNDIYPQAFSLMTRISLNRNGSIEEALNSIKEGKIMVKDLVTDGLYFGLTFYLLSHLMGDNPWILFDSLLGGNTNDTNRILHDGLVEDNIEENLLQLLINSLHEDENLNSELKRGKDDYAAYIKKQVELYWKN